MTRSPARHLGVPALLATALAVAVALAATAAGAAVRQGGPTAQAEYQAALKAAATEDVHFDSSATQAGVTIVVDGDTGSTMGEQTLTVTKGKVVEHVRAMVVGPTGYLQGNATALHDVIGLTTKQAKSYAGKWLSFPTSNTGLATLVEGLLDAQVPNELQIGAPITYGPATTVHGIKALTIRGDVSTDTGSKIPVTLYVPATGTPLPIEEVTNPGAKGASSIHGIVTFSKWGQKTTETPPTGATSLLKLEPAQTSGATSTTAPAAAGTTGATGSAATTTTTTTGG